MSMHKVLSKVHSKLKGSKKEYLLCSSTPVLLPGNSHGWRSLVGCRLWRRTELDTTEAT